MNTDVSRDFWMKFFEKLEKNGFLTEPINVKISKLSERFYSKTPSANFYLNLFFKKDSFSKIESVELTMDNPELVLYEGCTEFLGKPDFMYSKGNSLRFMWSTEPDEDFGLLQLMQEKNEITNLQRFQN